MNDKSVIRSRNYLNQLKSSFIFKGMAILASFLVIPIMINYLGAEKYGVWSTLLSILSWIVMFDLGIANGLRNKLSEMFAVNEYIKAREYISTTYCAVSFIAIIIYLTFINLSGLVDWSIVFNTSIVQRKTLEVTINICLFFVLVNFILAVVNQVFNALQRTNLVVINQFMSNVLSLFFIFILSQYTASNIQYIAIAYGLSLFIANGIISFWFYKRNVIYKPAIKLVKKERLYQTLSLGSKFFIIQIAVIILFTTDRIVITQLLGPEFVTPYDVVFKLFSIVTIVHGIILAPLWNSYSDAFHRNDYSWMRYMMKKQLLVLSIIVICTFILILIAPKIIQFWIGDIKYLNLNMIFALAAFTLLQVWNNVFAVFLNGISETRVQVKTAILAAIINIPLSIFFVKYLNMGVEGIVLGTILSLSVFSVFGPYESYKKLYKGSHA